jgi:hypothetical protein
MAANPSSLYLMTPPTQNHAPKLTLVSSSKGTDDSNISQAELMDELCAMIQLLHMIEGKLATNQAKLSENSNSVSQLLLDGTSGQVQEAQKQEKAHEASLHESFWERLKDIVLKYVVPIFMAIVAVVVTACTFGAGAAIAAAIVVGATLLLTTPIPGANTSLLSMAATAIAQKLGQDFGWSQAKIQEVTGYINLALGVLIAIVASVATLGSGAGASVTALEQAGEEAGMEIADMASEEGSTAANQTGISAKGAVYFATQAFASQISGSNAFSDIIMGTSLNQNSNDKASAEKIGGIVATILNILVQIVAMIAGGLAMSGASASEGASLGSLFGQSTSTVLRGVSVAVVGTTVTGATNNSYEAYVDVTMGKLLASITKLLGSLKVGENISQQVSSEITQINTTLKTYADQYSSVLKQLSNLAVVGRSEVDAMLKIYQQA